MIESKQLKEDLLATGRKLMDNHLVVATWGNLSCRLPDNKEQFFITPSGISYDALKDTDLVTVDIGGEIIAGQRKPSTETRLHMEIYRARPDILAIIHTHSPMASAFAVARKEIPPILEELAQFIGGSVAVADYGAPGSKGLAQNVVRALGMQNGVLMANHGVVAVGSNLEDALTGALLIEKTAQVYLYAKLLGQPRVFDAEETRKLRANFLKKYGQ